MKYIVKINNELAIINVITSMPELPEGSEVIGLESEVNPNQIALSDAELDEGILVYSHSKAIERKLVEIRAQRDAKMLVNDIDFVIALKIGSPQIEDIKAEAQVLRDIPQHAEEAMAEMNLEEINSYNPFEA